MYVDVTTGKFDWREMYKLLIGCITPRPIALVSTISAGGTTNLAPFSWYNMVSANPPVCVVCPSTRRDGGPKDTLNNIKAAREFCIATVTEAIAQPMVRCATLLPPEQSEFDWSGLTPRPATKVKPPLVEESPVNIECRLRDIIEFGDAPGAGNLVLGDIVAMHVADWLLGEDGAIDSRKLRTVGRLGRQDYCTVVEPYELRIPEAP